MLGIYRPENVFDVTQDKIDPYGTILFDRDGVLADYGKPIDDTIANHVNTLIIDNPDKQFFVVTNGEGITSPIMAHCERFGRRIKQTDPQRLKSLVQTTGEGLLVTDSFSESCVARLAGIEVFYLHEKLQAHKYEELLRRTTRPIRTPIGRIVNQSLSSSRI